MKLSSPSISVLFALGLGYKFAVAENQQPASAQSRLIDKCCQVGRERAIEEPKFNCKLDAREALIGSSGGQRNLVALAAESLLARDPNFADQCEMILESCCMAHFRTKNCDAGKHFAKSGSACMDVELSKESVVATESFNDCCMSCSLGILAARNPAQNESATSNRRDRCKLMSPLASSLSGQLYEQTYAECCEENLPRPSAAVLQPDLAVDCDRYNPCSQRCVSGKLRYAGQDKCDCFAGYKLSSDGITCVDVDECKLNQHTCNRHSEICDNTKGGFRCLARRDSISRSFANVQRTDGARARELEPVNDNGELTSASFSSLRLCPIGQEWDQTEGKCQLLGHETNSLASRSASLVAVQNPRQFGDDVQPFEFRSFHI